MKHNQKEVRKRSVALAQDCPPLRLLCASLILAGILLSASSFDDGKVSASVVQEIFHFTGNLLGSMEEVVTGATIVPSNEEIIAIEETTELSLAKPEEKIELSEIEKFPKSDIAAEKTTHSMKIFSNYWSTSIISAFLLLTISGGIIYSRHKSKQLLTYPSQPRLALKSIPTNKVDRLNQRIRKLEKAAKNSITTKVIRGLPHKKNAPPTPMKTAFLRPVILEVTPEKLKLDQELVAIQAQISRLGQSTAQPTKIVEDILPTYGLIRKGEAEIQAEKKEFEGLSRILLYSLKRPYLLLRAFFPHHRTQKEWSAEEPARTEVTKISRKIKGNKFRPLNELEDLEKEIRKLRSKLKED